MSGVARFRDSKAIANNTPEIVVVRAWREDALLLNDQPTLAAAATAQHGIFSFLLNHGPDYSLRGDCALVENPAVFTAFERLGLPVGLVIYGQGRASNRLLEWLAGITSPEFTLLHLPDYDPVGLSELTRRATRRTRSPPLARRSSSALRPPRKPGPSRQAEQSRDSG